MIDLEFRELPHLAALIQRATERRNAPKTQVVDPGTELTPSPEDLARPSVESENPLMKIPPRDVESFLIAEIERMASILKDPSQFQIKLAGKGVKINNVGIQCFLIDHPKDEYSGTLSMRYPDNEPATAKIFSFPSQIELGGKRRTIDCDFFSRRLIIDSGKEDSLDVVHDENQFDYSKEPYNQFRDALNQAIASKSKQLN